MRIILILAVLILIFGCADVQSMKAFIVPPETLHQTIQDILIMSTIYPYDDMTNSEKKELCQRIDSLIYDLVKDNGAGYVFIPASSVYPFFDPSDSSLILFNQSGYWNEAALYNLRRPILDEFDTDAILQVIIFKSIAECVDGEACWNGVCRTTDDLNYEPSGSILNVPLFFFPKGR